MKPHLLALTALEDRLTPADVVVNYIIYFVDGDATFASPTLGTAGQATAGQTNGNLLTTGGVRTSGLTNAGFGNTGFRNSGLGTPGFGATSLGLTGLGAGSLTNAGTGGVGPSTVVTGTSGLTGTNLVGASGNTFNGTGLGTGFNNFNGSSAGATNPAGFATGGLTNAGFGNAGFGNAGAAATNFGNRTGSVFTGNGATTVNGFNAINGLGTAGTTNTGTANAGFATPFVGGTGFGFSGDQGLTITTTIAPNGGSPLVTTTATGANGTTSTVATPTEVAAARATRSALRTTAGDVGVVVNPFPGYGGELRTAVADVTGDGVPDTVVAPGDGGGPRVAVFDGRTGEVVADFFAYDDALRNGVNVAAGDLDGDGRAEIVTGAGPGGGPRVRSFTLAGGDRPVRTADFFAFDPSFRGGVTVAVGDILGTGVNSILTGAGQGGGPRVDAFTAAGQPQRAVFVGDANSRSGASVAGATRAADGRILLAAGGAQAGLFDAATGQLVRPLGASDATTPATASLTSLGGQQSIRVARAGQPDGLFDLNGVAVG